MIDSGFVKRGLAAVVLVGTLAACDGLLPQQGYEKVSRRTRAPIEVPSNPPPPPARPGLLGGGAGAVPKLPAGAPSDVTQAMVEQGAQQFGTVCSACHGSGGQGTAAAPKLADAEWLWFDHPPTVDELVSRIEQGVPNPKSHPAAMPPRGGGNFTDAQVRQIAAYVYALSHQGS
jgi:mono/diheme cytochrome c family protein